MTSAMLVSTLAVAETSDSQACVRLHIPEAVRMIITGGASVRGTAAVNELLFFPSFFLRECCSSVHGRWF